ncbi:hypothetical protein C8R45DRAFT_145265 [Mycena sanguinolenta]|nr:hypothetical protein C8R45DRAFT_145265 [Mycena sanguinolenta]
MRLGATTVGFLIHPLACGLAMQSFICLRSWVPRQSGDTLAVKLPLRRARATSIHLLTFQSACVDCALAGPSTRFRYDGYTAARAPDLRLSFVICHSRLTRFHPRHQRSTTEYRYRIDTCAHGRKTLCAIIPYTSPPPQRRRGCASVLQTCSQLSLS